MGAEDLRDLVAQVEGSGAFASFAQSAPEHHLVHLFAQGKTGDGKVELGYYDPSADAITVFGTGEAEVSASDAQEVFREAGDAHAGAKLEPLALETVRFGLADARERLSRFTEAEHAAHPIAQEILILRQQDGVPVWAATLLTHTLHVLLVQLDARSGEVRSQELRNVLDLRAPE